MSANQNYVPVGDGNFGVEETEQVNTSPPTTAFNLPENVLAPLAYLFGFPSAVLLLVVEKNSEYVRFHAWQSAIMNLMLFAIYILVTFLSFLSGIVSIAVFFLYVYTIYRAFKDAPSQTLFKLPIIGQIAENQVYGTNSLPF
ncbi:hypothetical protein BB560_000491 [Smittium megazygosporum]|uniref:Uncharacterized protein n=1 Tax=Smittium megazygosporum TaxID=133381 RepID=A0A2T9ZKB3_9FUNG|nr:hypothetical protein BB560_000491 [Smittium megazygosporum]